MILQFLPLEPDELPQNIIFLNFAVIDDLFYNMIILPNFFVFGNWHVEYVLDKKTEKHMRADKVIHQFKAKIL